MIQGSKLFFLLALVAKAVAFDYCTICKNHPMCMFPDETPGPNCNDDVKNDKWLTQKDKDALLKKHNDLRALVTEGKTLGQPAALNMKILTWDEELEQIAKRWALQCTKDLELCMRTKEKNQFIHVHKTMNYPTEFLDLTVEIVQEWYDEHKYFPSSLVANYANPHTGRPLTYSLVVWANTERIGCARIVWGARDPATLKPNGVTVIFVCNYWPRGNRVGQPVYETAPDAPGNSTSPVSKPTGFPLWIIWLCVFAALVFTLLIVVLLYYCFLWGNPENCLSMRKPKSPKPSNVSPE